MCMTGIQAQYCCLKCHPKPGDRDTAVGAASNPEIVLLLLVAKDMMGADPPPCSARRPAAARHQIPQRSSGARGRVREALPSQPSLCIHRASGVA